FFASSHSTNQQDVEGGRVRLWPLRAPEDFLKRFSEDSYHSHVYKGHLGLARLYALLPDLPWYCLAGDDVYLFEPWVLEALREATSRPGEEAVCGGFVEKVPYHHSKETFKWMSIQCLQQFGIDEWGANCVKMAYDLLRPYAALDIPYGAAIFCSNAAMAKLAPFLSSRLVSDYMDEWEAQSEPIEGTEGVYVDELFRPYIPVSDILLGLCMSEQGIKLYNFDDG
ncbi:unnamed protein product, partial [Symbiodinium microadriaticum]